MKRLLASLQKQPFEVRLLVSTVVVSGIFAFFSNSFWIVAAIRGWQIRSAPSTKQIKNLKPLHTPKPLASSGDWDYEFLERGQSVSSFKSKYSPTLKAGKIYLRAADSLSTGSKKILLQTAEFAEAYFCKPVSILPPLSLASLPASARRWRSDLQVEQVKTTSINHSLLRKTKPADSLAYLAVTDHDLWPGRGWNYVFGEAVYSHAVGVYSLSRLKEHREAKTYSLLRSIKVSTHEIGHMLGLQHCVAYSCNMNGGNSLKDVDSAPLSLCPSCLEKISWRTGCDPCERFNRLSKLLHSFELTDQARVAKEYARAVCTSGVKTISLLK